MDRTNQQARPPRGMHAARQGSSVTFALAGACLLSFFLPAPVQGQTPTALAQFVQLENLYQQQKRSAEWDSAGKTARRMLEFARQNRLAKIWQLAALDNVALVELNLGHFEQSLELYQELVAGCKQPGPVEPLLREGLQLVTFNGLNGVGRCYRELDKFGDANAAFHAAIAYAQSVGQHEMAATAGADLGHFLIGQGEYAKALAEFQRALPTLHQAATKRGAESASKNNYASALQGTASVYVSLGNYSQAEPYARSALGWTEATVGRTHPYRAQALKALAVLYQNQQRYEEAAPLYEEGVRIYAERTGIEHPHCLGIMQNLARIYVFIGRPDDAIEMSKLVLAAHRKQGGAESLNAIDALANLANVYYQLDRNQEAGEAIDETLKLCEQNLPPHHPTAIDALRLRCSLDLLGDQNLPGLVERLDRLVEHFEGNATSPGDLAAGYLIRASALEKLGKRKEALQDMDRALKHAELQRALAAGGERERAKLFEKFSLVYGHTMAWHMLEGGDGIEAAFEIAERMKARSFVDVLQTADFDFLAWLPADERQRRQAEEKQIRDALAAAQQAFDALPSQADGMNERRRQAAAAVYAARDRLYDHTMRVQNAHPTYRKLITQGNQATSLKSVQRELVGEGELLLSYAAFGTRMFVFSVRNDAATFTELTVDPALASKLGIEPGDFGEADLQKILLGESGLLARLSRPDAATRLDPQSEERLAALWQVLIPAEERPRLLDGSPKLLTVLPDGLLSLLPLETLIVRQTDDGPLYLLDAGPPIAYAPSASVLANLAARPRRESAGEREPVLTLGDPTYGQSASAAARGGAFRGGLARLPFSGNETTWVAQHFNKRGVKSVQLSRGDATEANLRRLISGREVVHLACHGMAEDRFGNFFGCLAVAPGKAGDANDDGFLYTPEIYQLDLSGCELAILSACETNFGPQQTGEGVWTISRGFLVSGARRVIASNWVVSDEAGATLVSYFAYNLANSQQEQTRGDYALALQQAKLSLRKQEKWANPFFWSGLVLVGPN